MTTVLSRPARIPKRVSFRERNPVTLGITGMAGVVALLVVLFNTHAVISTLTSYDLEAVFSEAGGLRKGNDVRLLGQPVGRVTEVSLDRNTVLVKLQVERGVSLGAETRAQVKTATALGVKYVALIPEGDGALRSGDRIPLSRTRSAYDIAQALSELTRTAQGVDSEQLAGALDEVSKTFRRTPAELARTLQGVQGLSDAIATRDAQLEEVFARTATVSRTLAERRDTIRKLLVSGDQLAAELTTQRISIEQMIREVSALADQLQGLVDDGRTTLRPALQELQQTLDLLLKNKANLEKTLVGLPLAARGLGESVGNGPFYNAYVGTFTPEGFPVFRE